MRNDLQGNGISKIRTIDQQLLKPPVIQLHRRLLDEAGEELMLSELLGAVNVRILRQRIPRDLKRRQENGDRRFAHGTHAPDIR
jgi:hypothetical protein